MPPGGNKTLVREAWDFLGKLYSKTELIIILKISEEIV